MATIQLRSKFIDIFWMFSRNSHPHSDKVLLTRNERSTCNLMFKENHLLWSGHPPVRVGIL
ncbi:hypothetical protein [Candidatus Williamhamiltonella defendens]|nr:hypothetical protein [Candidatus Hamiltonella defensa]